METKKIFKKIDKCEEEILKTVGIKRSEYTKANIRQENLHYLEFGHKNKHTILLVHGYGGSGISFYRIIPELMKFFHVIAVDLMGFGKSDRPDFSFSSCEESIRFFTIPLVTLINIKKIDKLIVLGHSLGGLISSHLCLLIKEKIIALFLVGSAGFTNKTLSDEESELVFRHYGKYYNVNHKVIEYANYLTFKKKYPVFDYLLDSWKGHYIAHFFENESLDLSLIERKLFTQYYQLIYTMKACGSNCIWGIVQITGHCEMPSIDILKDNRDIECFIYYGDEEFLDIKQAYEACKKYNLDKNFRILPKTPHQVFFANPSGFLAQFLSDVQKVFRDND